MVAIRTEAARDRAAILAIQEAAFGRPNEAALVDALRRAASPLLSLVAETAGEVVGHVLLSPVAIESAPATRASAGLAPLAVHPSAQRRGIGGALVRAGLARCAGPGWRAVFLVGSPVYYARFGFRPAAPLGFSYGDPAFDPALQVVELEAGALDGCGGRVRFHPAFAATGCG